MVIREARIEDLNKIAGIYVANWKATYRGLLSGDYLDNLNAAGATDKWKAFMKESGNRIFVAEASSEILGFGACKADSEIENCLYIDALHVNEDSRGKGIGTKLLGTIAEYAVDAGYELISICIVRGNDAAGAMYKKLGAAHFSFFIDDFGGTKSHSEKLIWPEVKVLRESAARQ